MRSTNWLRRHHLAAVLMAVSFAVGVAAAAASPASPQETTPAQPKAANPAPIPLSEIPAEAEAVSERLGEIQADLSSDRSTEAIANQLLSLTREIDARLGESRKIVAQRPSIEMLRGLEATWWRLRGNLSGWARELISYATQLEEHIGQLDELRTKWEQTNQAAKDSNMPPEIMTRIHALIAAINRTSDAIKRKRAQAVTVQGRVAAQDARISDALASTTRAREEVLKRLFVKDSPAIWSAEVRSRAARELLEESRSSFLTQWTALRIYAERNKIRFSIHLIIFIALAAGLHRTRRRIGGRISADPEPAPTGLVFETPIAAALVLSFLCSRWIYPQPPRLLWAALGALALIPSIIILRRVIQERLYSILYALVAFYCLDQIRSVTAAVQVLPRLIFFAEMLAVVGFQFWLLRSMDGSPASSSQAKRLSNVIRAAGRISLGISAVALIGNAVGYVTLANLAGNSLLGSAYFALILYAGVEVLDGLFMIALGTRPLALLSVVRRHQPLLRRRFRLGLHWIAIVLWVLFALERLLLRERLFRIVWDILAAKLTVGSIHISLGDVLAFALTVWAAFLVSRLVRFLLDEDVYPRVNLTRGLPYAISTMLHYIILLVGFFAAVAALGLDMTKVTILAGAFSVGVGFGLQNIFNNFVSGLILLFERPVNVGDVVQMDDALGVVERIGIRASIIRISNGSEIIVPNGKLISERVVNWTLSSRQHSIELPVAVAQGIDPGRVIQLLERTAAAHPLVTSDPRPQALVVKLGPDSVLFELRAWTDRIEQWMQIRSELAITISAALAAEKIAIR
ncbi:MAG: mechanosensitive ion channel [Deltaproteobacteria bacterium]|nr:mechanosensitive ion channel [Deltaproteobacteria bacterium]